MSTYLILLPRGEDSVEVEADFYGQDGNDFVFTSDGREVRRVSIFDVSSISKAR
jgi:hypothetical protein